VVLGTVIVSPVRLYKIVESCNNVFNCSFISNCFFLLEEGRNVT
jgi:hypothetical protein